MRPPNRRHPLATIKPPVLFCGPRLLIAPGLEIGLGAFRQVVPPRRFQRRAGRLEGWRGATAVIAGFGSGIEAALPLPAFYGVRVADALGDGACQPARLRNGPASRRHGGDRRGG